MIRAIATLCAFGAASAFAPARVASRSASLMMSYENAPGVQAPAGFFDPLGNASYICQCLA